MLVGSIVCCLTPLKGKNREQACAGSYIPVCVPVNFVGLRRSQAEGIDVLNPSPFFRPYPVNGRAE
jgi:hypothetical protein